MRTEVTHEIETPELVNFEFELAGLASRGLAWCLDMVLIVALLVTIGLLSMTLGLASAGWLAGPALAITYVLVFLVQWGYFVFFEWRWHGQTPGKRAMSLRVLQETGVRLTFQHSLVRNLVRMLDSLPIQPLVGAVAALASRRRQRLGDLVAGTVVVRERRPPHPSAIIPPVSVHDPTVLINLRAPSQVSGKARRGPDAERTSVREHRTAAATPPEAWIGARPRQDRERLLPPSERYNTLLQDHAAAARARAVVTPRLRELLIALAMRRETLEVPARLSLFRSVAEHIQSLGVARPPSISDERFVLGVTAAALGAGKSGASPVGRGR